MLFFYLFIWNGLSNIVSLPQCLFCISWTSRIKPADMRQRDASRANGEGLKEISGGRSCVSIFGQLLCSAADERSICCVREGFWMSVNGEGGGLLWSWHTVCTQTHSTGSPVIPLACVPAIHHKYFSSIIPQPCPSHFAKRGENI